MTPARKHLRCGRREDILYICYAMKDIAWKLSILGDAAKYDASCASSGSSGRSGAPAGDIAGLRGSPGTSRTRGTSAQAGSLADPVASLSVQPLSTGIRSAGRGGFGSTAPVGICHAWASDGRCISLLKVLFTNACVYDCAYCRNRRSNDIPRAAFTVSELVDLTIGFYRRNYIEGLFLSSGITGDPEYTMRKLLTVVRTLRIDRGFNGYIHVKAIPGASARTIRETGFFADRMSVNIELPTERSLTLLAPEKRREDVFGPMALIDNVERERGRSPSVYGRGALPGRGPADWNRTGRLIPAGPGAALSTGQSPFVIDETLPDICREPTVPYGSAEGGLSAGGGQPFVPAGQSTQMIVGASPEPDSQIIRLAEGLYRKFGRKRVYYSAYIPVNEDPRLPSAAPPPLLREHRLYQADWLLRFYRFSADEITTGSDGDLDQDIDPKAIWALSHFSLFPVEVKTADYDTLLRVPGIGVISARRIMSARRSGVLSFDSLKRAGVVLKRAKYFITCGGRSLETIPVDPDRIRAILSDASVATRGSGRNEAARLGFDTPAAGGPDTAAHGGHGAAPEPAQPELPW